MRTSTRRMQQTTKRMTTTKKPTTTTTEDQKMDDTEFQAILETLRTGPGMRWKSANAAAPVLTPEELRQMLEDTHVSKVGRKQEKIDPLIALLDDDTTDTKIRQTKKSGHRLSMKLENSKTRDATSVVTPVDISKITKRITSAPEDQTQRIKNMWGNLNPNAARFRMANPSVRSAAPRTTANYRTTTTPKPTTTRATTTTPNWYRYTSTLDAWVQERVVKLRIQSQH